MDLKIVNMDIVHLRKIEEQLEEFDEFWNKEILKDEFENTNSKYFVVLSKDEVLAFGGIWFNIDEAHVMNIAVKKEFRRKSIGTKLLQYLIKISENEEKKCITLEVRDDNKPAIGLYEKMNFQEVGRRKKYYNNSVDAIIMTRNFNK